MIGKRVSMLVAMSLAFVGVSALDASAAVARPNLAVVGAKVDITTNCSGPAPAMIAAVRIKNSGGPLAANMGKVFLRESSGTGLAGAANLPAFGAGQEQTVNVPATSLQPFSRLVGSHQLQVTLRPNKNMFVAPAPYNLTAVFPGGHCGGVALLPRIDPRSLPPSAVGRPSSGVPIPLPRDLRPTCPDLAASRIDFSIVSRRDPYHGRVSIVGVVKNVGTTAYESGPTQQAVQLYEGPYYGLPTGRRLVAQQAFQNLAPGQEISVRYERDWYSASPAEGEFPPSYTVMVSYDPDIGLDSNPRNNDCVNTNNMRERNGDDINGLFRR